MNGRPWKSPVVPWNAAYCKPLAPPCSGLCAGEGQWNTLRRRWRHGALEMLKSIRMGLDHIDHKLLTGMIERFRGGPVGIDTISASIGEESVTIEDVYEPYLLQIGFIQRTPRGQIELNSLTIISGMQFPGLRKEKRRFRPSISIRSWPLIKKQFGH